MWTAQKLNFRFRPDEAYPGLRYALSWANLQFRPDGLDPSATSFAAPLTI